MAAEKRDYYEVLGVDQSASEDEIKRIAEAYQMEADKVKSLVDAAAVSPKQSEYPKNTARKPPKRPHPNKNTPAV